MFDFKMTAEHVTGIKATNLCMIKILEWTAAKTILQKMLTRILKEV